MWDARCFIRLFRSRRVLCITRACLCFVFLYYKGGVARKGSTEAVALDTKVKVVQETIIIEEGEKTLEDVIEEQRAKLHKEGKKASTESKTAGKTTSEVVVFSRLREFGLFFFDRRFSQCLPLCLFLCGKRLFSFLFSTCHT